MHFTSVYHILIYFVSQLEAEIGLLSSKEIDSANAATKLQMEKAHLEKQLDRKTLECEELSKSHLNKFSQLKAVQII